MLEFSEGALTDADILLYVTDVIENPEKNKDFLDRVAKEDVLMCFSSSIRLIC